MSRLLVAVVLVGTSLGDPASELREMEAIMMTLFPYSRVLNPRVGPEQLASRVAGVFGIEYQPQPRPRSYQQHNAVGGGFGFVGNKEADLFSIFRRATSIQYHIHSFTIKAQYCACQLGS